MTPTWHFASAVLLFTLVAPACAGTVISGDPMQGADATPSSTPAQPSAPPAAAPDASDDAIASNPSTPPAEAVTGTCQDPGSAVTTTLTEQTFSDLLFGVWILCNTPSVFGSTDEAGLEIVSDHKWYKLYSASDGTLHRGTGPGRRGTWEILDTSSMNGPGVFQLNLNIEGSGTVIVQPQFTTSPRKLRMNNMGVYEGTYVLLGDVFTPPGPPTEIEATVPPTVCPQPSQGVVSTLTQQAFVEQLVGTWLSCKGSVFGTNEVGLDFAADGTWHKLFPGSKPGTIVWGTGFDNEGKWSALDTSDMNGPGVFQLNLDIAGGGGIGVFPEFGASPRKMLLNNGGMFAGDYAIDP